MAHIKIKHNKSFVLNDGVKKVMEDAPPPAPEKLKEIFDNSQDYEVIVTTTDGRIVTGFQNPAVQKPSIIYEPNPIVTFFAVAQKYTQFTIDQKNKLLAEMSLSDMIVDKQLHKTHNFISVASISTLFMFTSLETMLNIQIEQNNKPLMHDGKERSVEYILRKVLFGSKVKEILPQIHTKNFHSDFGHKYDEIKKLKDLRNNIMHYKSGSEKVSGVRPFITAHLKFEFEMALEATKDFINYYNPNLIEYCPCGKDL